MRGIFNPTYFGLNSTMATPSIVLTGKDVDPLKHINIQKISDHESFVTFSSTEPIDDKMFNSIFKTGIEPVFHHSWKAAYPIFKPLTKLHPTRLDNGLIYANSLEAVVSSMETAMMPALNAAKIIRAEFQK